MIFPNILPRDKLKKIIFSLRCKNLFKNLAHVALRYTWLRSYLISYYVQRKYIETVLYVHDRNLKLIIE